MFGYVWLTVLYSISRNKYGKIETNNENILVMVFGVVRISRGKVAFFGEFRSIWIVSSNVTVRVRGSSSQVRSNEGERSNSRCYYSIIYENAGTRPAECTSESG